MFNFQERGIVEVVSTTVATTEEPEDPLLTPRRDSPASSRPACRSDSVDTPGLTSQTDNSSDTSTTGSTPARGVPCGCVVRVPAVRESLRRDPEDTGSTPPPPTRRFEVARSGSRVVELRLWRTMTGLRSPTGD